MNRAVCCLMFAALPAAADEGAYQFIFGPGVGLREVAPTPAPLVSVLAESTFGLTDRWNWELPVWVDFAHNRLDASLGAGIELVFLRAGRLQCNVGAGSLFAIPILPRPNLQIGPYLEAAARWNFIWGIGVGLELHGGYRWPFDGTASAPFASAVLAVHSEL